MLEVVCSFCTFCYTLCIIDTFKTFTHLSTKHLDLFILLTWDKFLAYSFLESCSFCCFIVYNPFHIKIIFCYWNESWLLSSTQFWSTNLSDQSCTPAVHRMPVFHPVLTSGSIFINETNMNKTNGYIVSDFVLNICMALITCTPYVYICADIHHSSTLANVILLNCSKTNVWCYNRLPAGVVIIGLQKLGGETMHDKRQRERRELHELRVAEWLVLPGKENLFVLGQNW